LRITANGATKTYDGAAFSGGNGVTYTGLVNGETSAVLSGTLTYGGTSQGAVNVGSYSIVPGGLSDANYNITWINGTLNINAASIAAIASAAMVGADIQTVD